MTKPELKREGEEFMCPVSVQKLSGGDSETPWTIAHQAPRSVKFSMQEYCSRLPFPSPSDLPDPGIGPCLLIGRQTLYHSAA